jgi:hypothetical protein
MEIKKLINCWLLFCLFTQSGCTILRYSYEPALNEVAKEGKIKRITNDYIEYSKQSTNVTQTTNIVETVYRAYYTSEGKVMYTKQVE